MNCIYVFLKLYMSLYIAIIAMIILIVLYVYIHARVHEGCVRTHTAKYRDAILPDMCVYVHQPYLACANHNYVRTISIYMRITLFLQDSKLLVITLNTTAVTETHRFLV